ncbi:MAG: prepilin-type N-terminal cleavage/methylation domain-containing protein, partial [Clostridia bacterium]|nr:prepilin-type N-terminal cleavage/methylation domain-containing protein [Clostridia bacterium]
MSFDKKPREHKRGFTLVELVIVIAVIALLATVLIPAFSCI